MKKKKVSDMTDEELIEMGRKGARHKWVYVPELDGDIDVMVVDLVKLFNKAGFLTFSSCQGEKKGLFSSRMDGAGNVLWIYDSWEDTARATFQVAKKIFEGMRERDVCFRMWSAADMYVGGIYFRQELIPELEKRLKEWSCPVVA